MECVPDHLGNRHALILCSTNQSILELWIEANGLDRRLSDSQPRPTPLASTSDELLDVVATSASSASCSMSSSVTGVPALVCPWF